MEQSWSLSPCLPAWIPGSVERGALGIMDTFLLITLLTMLGRVCHSHIGGKRMLHQAQPTPAVPYIPERHGPEFSLNVTGIGWMGLRNGVPCPSSPARLPGKVRHTATMKLPPFRAAGGHYKNFTKGPKPPPTSAIPDMRDCGKLKWGAKESTHGRW